MLRTTLAQVAYFLLLKNHLAGPEPTGPVELIQALIGLPVTSPAGPALMVRARMRGSEGAGEHPPQGGTGGSRGAGERRAWSEERGAEVEESLPSNLPLRKRPTSNLYPPSSNLPSFHPSILPSSLLHTILMRSSDYIIPTADFPAWHAATARQHNQDFNAEFRLWGLANREVESLAEAIRAVIGPAPVTEEMAGERLPAGLARTLRQVSRGGRVKTAGTVGLVLRWLAARGELAIELTESGRPAYTSLAARYPELDLAAAPIEATAQAALARAYLATFGPASEADLSFWTGFSKSETARALGTLAAETTLVLVEGLPGMMLLLRSQAEALAALSPIMEGDPIVNVLPADDPLVTAHRASRARLLPDPKLQRQVFTPSGAAQPTILVNGQVAGLWQLEPDGQVTWRLLVDVEPAILPLIEAEMEGVKEIVNCEL